MIGDGACVRGKFDLNGTVTKDDPEDIFYAEFHWDDLIRYFRGTIDEMKTMNGTWSSSPDFEAFLGGEGKFTFFVGEQEGSEEYDEEE